ncbi:MAG: N-acetylmuramoyl-L-alanine amidase [Patescibacteria group bacterium]
MINKLFVVPVLVFSFAVLPTLVIAETSPLVGKIIALDAGHGGVDGGGATGYCNGVAVAESEVNLAVRALVKAKIDADGGFGYEVAQLDSRSDRVADAENAGSDVLISIHHNGSTNTSANYTQSFVTQKNDKLFASFIHPKIVFVLGLVDKGIKNDGYGMTVYGSLPGVLTESFFITNESEACNFLVGDQSHVHAEAQAMYDGLVAYFMAQSSSGGGNGKGRNR